MTSEKNFLTNLLVIMMLGVSACGGSSNTGAPNTFSTTIDNITSTAVVESNTLRVTVDFGRIVTGFETTDVQIVSGGGGLVLTVVESTDNQIFTLRFTISANSADTLQMQIPAGAVSDSEGRVNAETAILSFIYDRLSPIPQISTAVGSATSANPIPVSINFSEPVSGFTLDEIAVTNGTPSNFLTVSNQNYTVEIIPAGDGEIQVSLAAGVAQDSASNMSVMSNVLLISYQASAAVIYYQENFDSYSDNSAWPGVWAIAPGSQAVSATIQSGQACMQGLVLTTGMDPSGANNLVRMVYTGLSVQDFEARFDLFYDDFQNQGAGFYGRQNGQFFNSSATPGQGYGFFLKGFAVDQLTFWYELLGDEIPHHEVDIDSVLNVTEGQLVVAVFHVVYQVQQISPTETRQRAKIWLSGEAEPIAWQIISDNIGSELPSTNPMTIPALQNLSDGFAIDLYNSSNPSDGNATTQSLCVDNLMISQIQQSAGPLENTSPITLVTDQFGGTSLGFLEGPVWRESEQVLLFTDISNDRIYSLDPSNDNLSIFRNEAATGSENYANGLANDVNGDLLIAEQSSQSIVRRFDDGSEVTVVDNVGSIAFNSPNDLISHSNGNIYFTDPTYGNLIDPGINQSLGFQAVYRIDSSANLSQVALLNQPNGIGLSPDQTRLYVTESGTSIIRVYSLNANGSVNTELTDENLSTALTGGGGGDGMVIDTEGNLYVATTNGVWVVAPDGTEWGLISTPQPVRNIAFGNANHKTLYLTLGIDDFTAGSLYRVNLNIAGIVAPYQE